MDRGNARTPQHYHYTPPTRSPLRQVTNAWDMPGLTPVQDADTESKKDNAATGYTSTVEPNTVAEADTSNNRDDLRDVEMEIPDIPEDRPPTPAPVNPLAVGHALTTRVKASGKKCKADSPPSPSSPEDNSPEVERRRRSKKRKAGAFAKAVRFEGEAMVIEVLSRGDTDDEDPENGIVEGDDAEGSVDGLSGELQGTGDDCCEGECEGGDTTDASWRVSER